MRTKHRIILLSLLFGLFIWLLDASLDYFFFYEGTFLELLLTDTPEHEIYIRCLIVICFVIFGFIAANLISKIQSSESNLRQALSFEKKLIDSIPLPIFIKDSNLRYTGCNTSFEEFYGVSANDIAGKSVYDIAPQKLADTYNQKDIELLESKGVQVYEYEIENAERRNVIFHKTTFDNSDGSTAGIIGAIMDMTDYKAIEASLNQKNKMEAIGYMAGGVAHNFNNNLAIILGNVELAKMRLPEDSQVASLLENVIISVQRSRDLVMNLVQYSKQGINCSSGGRRPTSLKQILEESVTLIKSNLPSRIQLQKKYLDNNADVTVLADPSQMQEVLINLCNNSVHAMEEEGQLIIDFKKSTLTQKDIPLQSECSPGDYVKISVQDSGAGIPKGIQDKIFDPFFSTKELHEGTGMGLATVMGIVNQHNGLIKVHSIPNVETIFDIYLPVSEGPAIESEIDNPAPIQTGEGEILFVDDEEMLTSLGKDALEQMGYKVTAFNDSQDALKLFSSKPKQFNLIITDQSMPGLTGKELIQEAKKVRPDIPIILCSGLSTDIDESTSNELNISAVLMKPLKLNELSQAVNSIIKKHP